MYDHESTHSEVVRMKQETLLIVSIYSRTCNRKSSWLNYLHLHLYTIYRKPKGGLYKIEQLAKSMICTFKAKLPNVLDSDFGLASTRSLTATEDRHIET